VVSSGLPSLRCNLWYCRSDKAKHVTKSECFVVSPQCNPVPGSTPSLSDSGCSDMAAILQPPDLLQKHSIHLEELEMNCLFIGTDYNSCMHSITWK
jgi:hypothetical protein